MAVFGSGYQSDQGQSPGAGQGASSAGLYGAIADILMKRAQDFTYNLQNLDDRVWLMRHFPNFYGWNSQGGGGGGYQEAQQAPTQTTFQNLGSSMQGQPLINAQTNKTNAEAEFYKFLLNKNKPGSSTISSFSSLWS